MPLLVILSLNSEFGNLSLNDELQVENTRIVEEACTLEEARIVMGENAERFIASS